jgi:hypothetical protein
MSHYTRTQALEFAHMCQNASLEEILAYAENQAATNTGKAWKEYFGKLASWLKGGELAAVIFNLSGNSKLPFAAFSTLPIVTCPGAGDCAKWCYSLRAWRYPAAFIRQAQNTIALRFFRRQVIDAFKALPQGVTFRLYVDGDFDSVQTVNFWFNLLRQRPDVETYGYSKSWTELLAVPNWPKNYILNLSTGGIGTEEQKQQLKSIPNVRGEFIAVKTTKKHAKGFKRYESPDYHRDVRQSAIDSGIGKVFSCPGSCGSCTGAGHACGLVSLSLPIAIGVH